MVRSLLNGAFANTAFCIFDPQGKERLTRSGRGPSMSMGSGRGRGEPTGSDDRVIARMNEIASNYTMTGKTEETSLQDFNTFRQALNVASADQRLLVFVNADKKERVAAESNLKKVFADDDIMGKFHLDFVSRESDSSWRNIIDGEKNRPGIIIIRAGVFGIDGTVMEQLPLGSSSEEIKAAFLAANQKFKSLEDRKTYSVHVRSGRRQGIYFENEIPYGEDRNADGKIDNPRFRKGR